MADSSKSKSKGGCLGKLVLLILFVAACGLGSAVYFAIQPQDLSDIGGYSPASKAPPARDLKAVLKSSIDRGYPLTLTETEINHWLGRTLKTQQGGLLAGQVSLDRVWVRLDDGVAEVIMERHIMGHPVTLSMFLQIQQLQGAKSVQTEVVLHGGPYLDSLPGLNRGGRFGRLVVPQGYLYLVKSSYQKLAGVYRDEIHLAFEEMARMKIERNRLVLDPREPASELDNLHTF